ncbi:ABC transporter permease [Staphylococcus lutrae]|uniref:Putative hemin transport system permease protein HrtB n=1 Tax=Staphylococcus lutrae TaxID=155085 RepID=A0AAC9WIY8_9STAP|nr:ABC transporter permease [Staphylococcus lutrae]ARJ50774.1 peptide ABC transporter permease [Staphylococcus lutrae]PNZ36131.1 ABC transporter permease [Staphylococcus lutrae]
MFLAWHEIRRNRLKFSLIIGILVLISYLLFLLSGLAKGLINMNTEGIQQWHANAIVLNKNANRTIEQSRFNKAWVDGKFDQQVSLKETRVIISNGKIKDNVLLYGTEPQAWMIPKLIEGRLFEKRHEVVADRTLKEKGFKIGDHLSLSQSNETLTIVGFSQSAKFNAAAVLFGNAQTIEGINPTLADPQINAVVVKDKDWNQHKLNSQLEIIDIDTFIEGLPGYKAQNLTLNFMISFLFAISATVIAVFLYVMTLQKVTLFGVLKAQGFTNGDLARVVMAQTLILALIGTGIGLLLTLLTARLLPSAVPIQFDWFHLSVFGLILIFVSLLGSLFSILTIRKIDPLIAIG